MTTTKSLLVCIDVYKRQFLINNGRLHCLYIQSAGDRKFPVAMSGTYDLAPYLASATIAGWGPVTGACLLYTSPERRDYIFI